jgi:hypothetical protein
VADNDDEREGEEREEDGPGQVRHGSAQATVPSRSAAIGIWLGILTRELITWKLVHKHSMEKGDTVSQVRG